HGVNADMLLVADRASPNGVIEVLAARALAPEYPMAWRRWGMVQLDRKRHLQAEKSFKHYLEIGGPDAARDGEAKKWLASIEAGKPRGVFAPGEDGESK